MDEPVKKYVLDQDETINFLEKIEDMLCYKVLNVTNEELRVEDCYISPDTVGGIGEIYVFKKVK